MIVVVIGVLWIAAAQAQAVYKCGWRSYSQAPCSSRVVHTDEAPVAANPKPGAFATRRLPGETVAQFNTRRKRSHLSETDRNECARLDKRLPFERERLKNSVRDDEIDDAQSAISASQKRFAQLRC